MNCSVCGSPLLFDRVVFRCACGAYVHAYCADKHIVDAHRPELEEGYADLNGDFHPKHRPEPAPAALVESVSTASGQVAGEDEEVVVEEELIMDDEAVGGEAEKSEDDDAGEDR